MDTVDLVKQKIVERYIDQIAAALWVFDIDRSRIVWANEKALEIWRADSLLDLQMRDLGADMSVSVARRLRQYQEDFERHDKSFSESWTIYPEGQPVTLNVIYRGFRLPCGRMAMLCEVASINTELPETLRSAEALLHSVVMISLYSSDGKPLYSNPAARASKLDVFASIGERFLDPRDHERLMGDVLRSGEARITARIRTPSGIRWHEITVRECRDVVTGNPALLFSENDVSDLKESEERVSYLADHDVLTGLPNRHFLQSRFQGFIRDASIKDEELVLFMLDLDRFKTVNDSLGHSAGDELLVLVARRLQDLPERLGFVSRLGGDEFLLCEPRKMSFGDAERFCQSILRAFDEEFEVYGHRLTISPSIGVSRFPQDGCDLITLLKHADVAMYDAKANGRNTYRFFTPKLRLKIEETMRMEKDVRVALERGEFELFYQPRCDTKTSEIVGAEALLRWNHPTRGRLAPDAFMSICEETGLIHDVGRWVMDSAATEQRYLQDAGYDIDISINLSPRQFMRASFCDEILTLPHRTGCDPTKIEFEITESLLMEDCPSTTDVLHAARAAGFSISIDDFGTGFSNLAYIQKYPIGALKIDKSFIQADDGSSAVVQLIIALCSSIKIKAIAEGVETDAQLDWLQSLGCAEYQGFLRSRPLPVAEFRRLLAQGATSATIIKLNPAAQRVAKQLG